MNEIAGQIEKTFKRERKQLVSLDWDTDIAPMLDKEDILLDTWQGLSMNRLVDSMRHTLEFAPNILGRPHQLLDARHIVFELSVHPDYQFPMSEVVPLSDFLASFPNTPEIKWGLSIDNNQELPVLLNIIYTNSKNESYTT